MDRVAEVDRESFVELVAVVAVDHHGDRLGCGRVGGKSQGAALGHVVGPGGGCAIHGGVVHGNNLRAGGRKGHAEVGIDGRPSIPFGHCHIADGNGRSIVVNDGRSNLLRAGFGTVGHAGDIDDNGLVHFVERILHRGQGNRSAGGSGRNNDRTSGAGVVSRKCCGARESEVDCHCLARYRRQGGRHRGDSTRLGHGTSTEAQGDLRRVVVVGNRVDMRRRRPQRGVGWIRQRDFDGLVGFVQRVVHDADGDDLVGDSGRESQGAAGQGVVHATAGGCAAGDRVIDSHRLQRGG